MTHITIERAKLEQALEALEPFSTPNWAGTGVDEANDSITAIKQALAAPVQEQHSDDLAVNRFATAMKAKMAKQRAKGYGGWDDPEQCPADRLRTMLTDHVAKGDPVDVGNFSMMLWNRGENTTSPAQPAPVQEPEYEAAWHKVWPDAGSFVRASSEDLIKFAKAIAAQPAPVPYPVIAGVLFDFMGWLTSREARLALSSTDDASPAVEAITEFAKTRGLSLDDARVQDWQDGITKGGAAPVQEPVAVCHDDGYWTPLKTEAGRRFNDLLSKAGSRINVYTTPPAAQRQWVGLSQEEQRECFQQMFDAEANWPVYADAIEAKLKEKNT